MFKRQRPFETSLGIALACAALLTAAGCAGKHGYAPKEETADKDPTALTGDKNVVQKPPLDPKMVGNWVSDCVPKDDGSFATMATFTADNTLTVTKTTYGDGSCKTALQSSLDARATVEVLESSEKGAKIAYHFDPTLAKDPGDFIESTEAMTWVDADNYEIQILSATLKTATGTREESAAEVAAQKQIGFHRMTATDATQKTDGQKSSSVWQTGDVVSGDDASDDDATTP